MASFPTIRIVKMPFFASNDLSSNPYDPVQQVVPAQQLGSSQSPGTPTKAPAIGLIIVASISLLLVFLSLVGDVLLLATGAVDVLDDPNLGSMTKEQQIMVRMGWGLLIMLGSGITLYGAIAMLKLSSYSAARIGAIAAAIPCVGPCCILGIPFGIWALLVLGKPEIRDRFQS